jgi:hypothetical protein
MRLHPCWRLAEKLESQGQPSSCAVSCESVVPGKGIFFLETPGYWRPLFSNDRAVRALPKLSLKRRA